jgi:hypothetical protein
MHFFIIDLKEGAGQQELLVACLAYLLQHVPEAPWYDSLQLAVLRLPHHRVGFAAASLAIGEYGAIVAF